MKKMLIRPTAALFPAVMCLASLLGNRAHCSLLIVCYFIMQLTTLCAVDSFRNAAAREPGVKRVDKRFSGTFLQLALGIAVGSAFSICLWKPFDPSLPLIPLCAASACIIIEQLFEERMFALAHTGDGVILSIVSNVLLLAGLLLDFGGGVIAPIPLCFTVCASALGMLISIIACYLIEPMHAFSLKPVNLPFFPRAALQSLLFPAVILLLVNFSTWMFDPLLGNLLNLDPSFFLGLALWRLSRTVCRRAKDESRPLNLLLVGCAALLMIAGIWVPNLLNYALMAWLALLCASIVFCAPGWRLYDGVILVYASFYLLTDGVSHAPLYACLLCALAIALNLHKAFLKKV